MIGIDSLDYMLKAYNPMAIDIKISIKDKILQIGNSKYTIQPYIIEWLASQLGLRNSNRIERDINNALGMTPNVEVLTNLLNGEISNVVATNYVRLPLVEINEALMTISRLVRIRDRNTISHNKGCSLIKVPVMTGSYALIGHNGKRFIYYCGGVPVPFYSWNNNGKLKLREIEDAKKYLALKELTKILDIYKVREVLNKAKRHYKFNYSCIDTISKDVTAAELLKSLGDVSLRIKRPRRIGTTEQCILASCALSYKLLGATK